MIRGRSIEQLPKELHQVLERPAGPCREDLEDCRTLQELFLLSYVGLGEFCTRLKEVRDGAGEGRCVCWEISKYFWPGSCLFTSGAAVASFGFALPVSIP